MLEWVVIKMLSYRTVRYQYIPRRKSEGSTMIICIIHTVPHGTGYITFSTFGSTGTVLFLYDTVNLFLIDRQTH